MSKLTISPFDNLWQNNGYIKSQIPSNKVYILLDNLKSKWNILTNAI